MAHGFHLLGQEGQLECVVRIGHRQARQELKSKVEQPEGTISKPHPYFCQSDPRS